MKTPTAVTLIIVGGLLIAVSPLADYLREENMARLLAQPGVNRVNLGERMSAEYRFGCWLVGAMAVAIAVWYSRPGLDGQSSRSRAPESIHAEATPRAREQEQQDVR